MANRFLMNRVGDKGFKKVAKMWMKDQKKRGDGLPFIERVFRGSIWRNLIYATFGKMMLKKETTKDGRKVRYYPASIDSSVSDDDLPVPVLTPDPNSLQGQILQILDIHENEILNLSQKELSDKLETSQQLVSYHSFE